MKLTDFSVLDYAHRKRMHPQQLSQKLQEKELNEQKQRIEAKRQKVVS
jgi:hypothetical protein